MRQSIHQARIVSGSSLLLLLVGSAWMGGCGWDNDSEWDYAVWSDDAEEVAYVKRSFESKAKFGHEVTRNHSVTVWRSTADTPNTKIQVSESLLGDISDLFFMRYEGYIILGRDLAEVNATPSESKGALKTRRIIYERLGLDGSRSTVAEVNAATTVSCDGGQSERQSPRPLRVIPSPDGSTLAVLTALTDCESASLTLRFVDPHSLETMGEPMSIDIEAFLSAPVLYAEDFLAGWLEDGSLVITEHFWGANGSGFRVEPGSEPTWFTGFASTCLRPATTSSDWRWDTLHAQMTPEGNLVFETDAGERAFGCDH